jgi:predicted ArsR family transcriptional regulator
VVTSTPRTDPSPPAAGTGRSLVSLLGRQRAELVLELRRRGDASVADLAEHLGVSEAATRRHLGVLAEEGLVAAETVNEGHRGRPAARFHLTDAAARLFPHRYDRLAQEMLDFLAAEHGREGLRAFLRWRVRREVDGLQEAVTADDLPGRLQQLADALSEAGFEASVTPDGEGFTLTQDHCAIFDVAKQHPEVCAYEAASFSQVLGRDVTLSRRQTLAGGSSACVCCVAPRPGAATAATDPQDGTARTDVPDAADDRPDHHDHRSAPPGPNPADDLGRTSAAEGSRR